MANKRPKPEEIVSKLRQVEMLMGKACPVWMQSDRLVLLNKPIIADVRMGSLRATMATGGMGVDQLKELKRLQKKMTG